MMRLIDADALMNRIEDSARNAGFSQEAYCKIKRFVATTPTIEAEPVRHGKWEWHINWGCMGHLEPIEPYDDGWACSACGIYLVQYLQSHFPDIPSYLECACEEMPTLERCPHCGAKMDLEG